MKAKVTENGVVIPRELLEGVEEVDIRKEDGVILVVPIARQDPIWGLGKTRLKVAYPMLPRVTTGISTANAL
jgi:hypothetical protein